MNEIIIVVVYLSVRNRTYYRIYTHNKYTLKVPLPIRITWSFQVNVVDRDFGRGSRHGCSSMNDPHITTFDGT